MESVSGHLLEEVHDQLPVKTSILRAYLRMSGFGKCCREEELLNNTLSAKIFF